MDQKHVCRLRYSLNVKSITQGKKMHAAWVAFATNGNPAWPQFDLKQRATMRFDTTSELVEDPHAAERVLWEDRR